MQNGELNITPTTKNRGSKSANFETLPKTEEVAMMEAMISNPQKEVEKEVTDEEVKEAIVYNDSVTSIDFMMPDEEKEILEKNLNLYDDMEQLQKALSIAKKNKKISEDIKTLDLISKSGKVSDIMFDILTDEETIRALKANIRNQIAEGDVMKGYKNLATANKIILDAREEMTRRLNSGGNKKNAKIALRFTNDSGETFELGADI